MNVNEAIKKMVKLQKAEGYLVDDKKILITQNGEELIQRTTDKINEKIIKIFKHKLDYCIFFGITNLKFFLDKSFKISLTTFNIALLILLP